MIVVVDRDGYALRAQLTGTALLKDGEAAIEMNDWPGFPADSTLCIQIVGGQIVRLDRRSIQDMRAAKWAAIRAAAAAADAANMTMQGNEFQADAASKLALSRKLQIALANIADSLPFSVDWTLANNTEIALNANQLKAVVRAIDGRTEQVRATLIARRAQIAAATTAAEVAAIVW